MLNEAELLSVVELHRRAYSLFRWIGQAIETGKIQPDQLHESLNASLAARQWLAYHYPRLPTKFRPRENQGPQFDRFANLLASYLTASFDLVDEPVPIGAGGPRCRCSFCRFLVASASLRPKKLKAEDKERARELMVRYLTRLAEEQGLALTTTKAEALVEDRALREQVAMATYGEQLLKRSRGEAVDVSALALWRVFAWEASGSPKQGFELSASDIVAAEHALMELLQSSVRGR